MTTNHVSTDGSATSPTSSGEERTVAAVVQSRYGGPETLRLARQGRPQASPGQVLVKVHAASINARDWHVMRGEPRLARLMDRSVFGWRGPKQAVPGTDFAGVIEAVGANVTHGRVGDAVFGEGVGTFAEYAVAAGDQIAPLPDGMSFEEAAGMPLAASTALQCLDEAMLRPGQSVLVNGASGGVGTFLVQAGKAMGVHVTAVVSPRNADMALGLGAEHVVNYTVDDFTRSGRSYDAVVDLVGNRRLKDLRRVVRGGGRLVLSGGGTPGTGRLIGPLGLLVTATAVARSQPYELTVPQARPTSASLERLSALVESSTIRPIIDRTYRLDQVPEALHYVEAEHARGKVVIKIR